MSDSRKDFAHRTKHLAFAVLYAVLLMATAGCGIFQSSSGGPLNLDYRGTLPDGWVPIGTWRQVNIDDDEETEYLLLFTYDQGQAGGAIYDSQISPDLIGVVDVSTTPVPTPTVELVPVPLQPLAYYRPYRLLPSSWSYSYGGSVGHGFLASPGNSGNIKNQQTPRATEEDGANQDDVAANNVDSNASSQDGVQAEAQSSEYDLRQPTYEMMILGGKTHLTFVWWRNQLYGYGITQLTAEGGFRGLNWDEWSSTSEPVEIVSGLHPLTDYRARSQFCHEIRHTRDLKGPAPDSGTPQLPIISFSAQDRGITFCKSIPPHPFYPEGVVMAYLMLADGAESDAAKQEAVKHLLTPDVDLETLQVDSSLIQLSEEMVNDIAAYETVPALPSVVTDSDYLPTTTVCVEAARREDPDSRRWVVFTLRYQPPDYEKRLPDRWTISGATEMPRPPGDQPATYCASVLNSLPE